MKLLFDQNLSPALVSLLATEFPDSAHVRTFGMRTSPDPEVWAFAAAHGYAIVSKDSDFEQRALAHGHPPKVVWLRVGNCRTALVANLLLSRLSDLLAFYADPTVSLLAVA
jgi:predicted nuclease of predicted toxin-antitoxin system